MKNFNRILSVIFTIFILLPLSSFSQKLDIINQNGSNIILEKSPDGLSRIIPQSGTNYNPSPNHIRIPAPVKDNINLFNWVLKFTAGNRVFKDISFFNPQVGYIVTELGYVYKSTNGGDNWAQVLGLGFPYYWYGVYALSVDTIAIAGFNDQGNIHSGVVRWSFNGGTTWTNDIVLTVPSNGVGWLTRIHFFDQNNGIVSNEFSGGIYYTTNGGKDSTSWHYVQVNSDLGWFSGNLDADVNGNIYTTGIHFAQSTNFGLIWTSGPSADGTLNTFPYPIRSVKYFSDTLMLVFGGNVNSEIGGIYSSNNSGATWNLEVNTSAEMFSYDYKATSPDSMDIWAVGSTGGSTGFTGKLYKARVVNAVVGIKPNPDLIPVAYSLYQNYPNPFNPVTTIKYQIPVNGYTNLTVYDILGNKVAVLVNENQNPGNYQAVWNASNSSSGIYFYKLTTGSFSETKKMLLIK
jgi:hypothetical protein